MAKKLTTTVVAGDPTKFGQPGAIEMLRNLASENGWTLGFAVFTAAEHFAPRKPSEVSAVEIEAAIPKLVAKGLIQKGQKQAEARKEAIGGRERFPFKEDPDEAQEWWDKGRWKDLKFGAYMTFGGLRKRFSAEIARGETISKAQVDGYQAELEAEKEKMVQLLDEKLDPDATGQELCEVPDGFHTGKREFQLTKRFKPEWADDGTVHRQLHKGGDEPIEVGNVLVLESDEPGEEPTVVIYCHACRQKVWQKIGQAKDDLPRLREALDKATDEKEVARLKTELKEAEDWADLRANFYTIANARRKLDAIKRGAEGHTAVLGQLKGASKRAYTGSQFGLGTRKGRQDWRTTRRGAPASR